MKRKSILSVIQVVMCAMLAGILPMQTVRGAIPPAATVGLAWSENTGWVNFSPGEGGVTVYETHLSGHAWSENIGWIKLGSDGGGPYANTTVDDWGVNKEPDGILSGSAWSESVGWINFSPLDGQVYIDEKGYFHGSAWSGSVGWINLNGAQSQYQVKTGAAAPYDFNIDDRIDVLYRHPDAGDILVWFMNGVRETSWASIINPYGNPSNHGLDWDIKGLGDFDGDGYNDFLYRHSEGNIGVWFTIGTNETTWQPLTAINGRIPTNHGLMWDIRGLADFNHDGHMDVLYRNSGNGKIGIWFMEGAKEITWTRIKNSDGEPAVHDPTWDIKGVGDFNGDGHVDLLWRPASGDRIGVWFMEGTRETSWTLITDSEGNIADHGKDWDIKGLADFNGDGRLDVLYRHSGGNVGVWLMNGTTEIKWHYINNHGIWDIR